MHIRDAVGEAFTCTGIDMSRAVLICKIKNLRTSAESRKSRPQSGRFQ
jgi:hypothetical protein